MLLLCSLLARAAPAMPVAGVVTQADGQPVHGPQAVTFRLYTDGTTGASQWFESATVEFVAGAFSTWAGSTSPIGDALVEGPLWMTIQVGAGAESDRTPVGWAPRAGYAARAGSAVNAASLDGLAASGWTRKSELAASTGLTLSGTTFSVAPSYVDGRVTAVGDARYVEPTDLAAGTGISLNGTTISASQTYVDGRVTAVGDARYAAKPATGGVQLSASTATCDAGSRGTLSYAADGTLRACTTNGWMTVLGAGGDGSSSNVPGKSCKTIKDQTGTTTDGLYWIDPDGDGNNNDAWLAWCDMNRNGGGWTLVMQNIGTITGNARPTYYQTIHQVLVRGGTYGGALGNFDLLVGLAEWADIGTTARYEVGSTVGTPVKQATATLKLSPTAGYALSVSGVNVTVGSAGDPPGIFVHHTGYAWSAVDIDQDGASNSCEASYQHPWWYSSCWSGSIWGSEASHTRNAYWVSSVNDYYNWGALWLR